MTQLPPSLTRMDVTYTRASTADIAARRADFSKNVKPAFLIYLAEHHTDELRAMNLSDAAIDFMRDGKFPRNHPGEQMDCTIDHILSLNAGGTNDFDNLMLVPARINAMKNDLEMPQMSDAATGTLTTIVPVGNARVPLIAGGFQKAKSFA